MADVELKQLHRRFGEVVALAGIDLDIATGEFVSLLGPSGCGKTTALRLVAGFDRPTSGRVVIDGKDVTDVPPNRRDIGMVFQAYSLFPNMTAVRNVEFGLRVRKQGRGDRNRRALELLDLVGLAQAADRYPHQLSGGMQQRVALARALAIEPRLLLLDEPLSALDAKVRVQLREEIRRIQLELGITTIYVTHDQEEALSISDRVAVMYGGKIEQIGPPAEMYGSPATPFVAEFIGTMNRLVATVADDGWSTTRGCRSGSTPPAGCRGASASCCLVRPETVDVVPRERLHPGRTARRGRGGLEHVPRLDVTRVRVADESGARTLTADLSTARGGDARPSARRSSRASRPTVRACSAWPTSQCFPCQTRTVGEHAVDAARLQREQA